MTASRARTVTPISASRPKSATKPKSKTTKAKNASKSTTAKSARVKDAVAPPPVPASSEPTHEQIAQRAYEIWLRKGRPMGLDEQNWKEAERELGVVK